MGCWAQNSRVWMQDAGRAEGEEDRKRWVGGAHGAQQAPRQPVV